MNSGITLKRVDELLAFLPIFETQGKVWYEWKGGELVGNTYHVAYPVYDEDVGRFMTLAGNKCWTDQDYTEKPTDEWIMDDRFIMSATLEEFRTMLTWCVRIERFCDGHWTHMLDEGRIVALLKRLQELRREFLLLGDSLETGLYIRENAFDTSYLRGFEGFIRVSDLKKTRGCNCIPACHGVYVIIRDSLADPVFLEREDGYPIDVLDSRWVYGTCAIYVGKAGGSDCKTTLRRRLSAYMRNSKSHRGGRSIWQLQDSDDLIVAWRTLDDETPAAVESSLIREFEAYYGRIPFANGRH